MNLKASTARAAYVRRPATTHQVAAAGVLSGEPGLELGHGHRAVFAGCFQRGFLRDIPTMRT